MNLKYVKLTNCLRIEEKEINLGKITLIEGSIETGKTSIIDSIRKGLKNEDIRPKFVNGKDKGIVFMQFDEGLEVTRTVKQDNKATLKVSKGGMSPNKPQAFLDELFGDNDFAPIDWLKKKDKEQTEDLLKLLPIKLTEDEIINITGKKVPFINYDQHGLMVCEQVEKCLMEERKETNASVKAYKANIDDAKLDIPYDYDPSLYRDVRLNDLFEEISEVEKINTEIDKAQSNIGNGERLLVLANAEYKTRLHDLEEELERRKNELKQSHGLKVETIFTESKKSHEFINRNTKKDTQELRAKAKQVEEGQSYLRTYDKLKEAEQLHDSCTQEADDLTDVITKIRELPSKLLSKAKSPIPGMGIDKGTVTIDNLPIKNLSDGAKMMLAITIAKATSKELKLILLNGFEQLNWSLQKEMFKEMQDDEFQYIITRVTDGDLSVSQIKNNQIVNTETGEVVEL